MHQKVDKTAKQSGWIDMNQIIRSFNTTEIMKYDIIENGYEQADIDDEKEVLQYVMFGCTFFSPHVIGIP